MKSLSVHDKTQTRHLRLRPLVLGLICSGLVPALAQTLPVPAASGLQAAGSVAVVPGAPAGTMNILQNTPRAVAQWQSFSIGVGGTVNITQPATSSVLLNRVVGNELSTIAGKLNANGQVFLVNPNGVLFSKGSAVNVGGLVASTLDVPSNDAFMAGGPLAFSRADTVTAKVVNQGSITATAGPVVLMGAGVSNEIGDPGTSDGTINVASGNTIGLVSANRVTVDFNGDGLTTFTIPADSRATSALVQNTGVLSANGGQVSLLAASQAQAQVVNTTGVIQARSLTTRGGQIVLNAESDDGRGSVAVGGTMDVSSINSGQAGPLVPSINGGTILTQGGNVNVAAGAVVKAGGSGNGGSNGTWTVQSSQDLTVANDDIALAGSIVNATALGNALGNSTNVVLNSGASVVNGQSVGVGVSFASDTVVNKPSGGSSTLTVNSTRNITMETGSAIRSSGGALNVDFNADAQGETLPASLPIITGEFGTSGGSIAMTGASIETNGGNIRFYGQSDPDNGRAVGSYFTIGQAVQGITLSEGSLLSACAVGQASCTGGGDISLRGEGRSTAGTTQVFSGVGVGIDDSTVRTGSGSITMDGRGALGASGVRVANDSLVSSGSGNISLTGTTRGWTAGADPVVTFTSDDTQDLGTTMGGGSGVSVRNSTLSTGGGITLDGTGADLQSLAFNSGFQQASRDVMVGNSATVGESHGVVVDESMVHAGVGQDISMLGTAGGSGYLLTTANSGLVFTDFNSNGYGVSLSATTPTAGSPLPTRFVEAEGGTITLDGRGTDVNLLLKASSSTSTNDSLLSVASGSQAGGSITVSGNNVFVDSDQPAPHMIDAGGTSGGKISLVAADTGGLDFEQAGLSADATTGKGGDILTQGGSVFVSNRASVSAAGGPNGANGTWTVHSGFDLTIDNSESGASQVDPGVLGRTLSRSTDVVLTSDALPQGDGPQGFGVNFGAGVEVIKDGGRDATLTVNSGRNIAMEANSALIASTGALNVNFNADANGKLPAANLPIGNSASAPSSGGAITINTAAIETNGGSIRFYGQSDPLNGRAVGSNVENDVAIYNGITVNNSLLSTCGPGTTACATPGDISLRGQGASAFNSNSAALSGVGVELSGSSLLTGAGAISVDGRGGVRSAGVQMQGGFGVIDPVTGASQQLKTVASSSGDITLTGSVRGWATGEPIVATINDCSDCQSLDGVSLQDTQLSTGGNIGISGVGADFTDLFNSAGYRSALRAQGVTFNSIEASNGVSIGNSSIVAGAGKQLTITGTGGSGALTVAFNDNGVATDTVDPARNGVNLFAFDYTPLQAAGGKITLDGGTTDVNLRYSMDTSKAPVPMVDASSPTAPGGSIAISGRNITVVDNNMALGQLFNASGAGGGGSISLRATADPAVAGSGMINLSSDVAMLANATGSGNGGTIRLVADGSLRAYGQYSARGGASGGDGGLVETSGSTFDVSGIVVDASAAAGKAGTWVVDPYNLTIVTGAASGSLPTEPFVPVGEAVIQDGDINQALNNGTNVSITTGSGGTDFGTISVAEGGASINLNKGTAPVTFRMDAAGDIDTTDGPMTIQSSAGPLNVVFNAGVGGKGGSIIYNGGLMRTNGGNVDLTAAGGDNGCAICLNSTPIDTRIGQSDANAGGNVTLTVPAGGPAFTGTTTAAVDLNLAQVTTSSGNVTITGNSSTGTGVRVRGTQGANASGGITTTTGNIAVTGLGGFSSNTALTPGSGVTIDGATLRTSGGSIAVHGLQQASGRAVGAGVNMINGATLLTTGSGDVDIAGESTGNGPGLFMSALVPSIPAQEFVGAPASSINGASNVVLRASNDGTTDAIVLSGTVNAANVLNLRPGGVDATTGAAVDRTANTITLVGTGAVGYAISADELTRLTAATVVAGSNTHAGDIDVMAPMTSSVPLTLENGGGGNITLNAPISAPTLGLISGGNITQAAGAGITAGSLLATSSGGNVTLADASNNVSTNTLAGSAAGSFEFVNSGPIRIGAVSVTGYDAAGNAPNVVSTTSMAADTVLVRTLNGDLQLASDVSSRTSTDLVAAATFQNVGNSAITGAPFRIWANTWVGETRGGIVGSGDFPNFYHCAYLGVCTVVVTPGDNHFIYAQQPTLTVALDSFTRPFGQDNPPLTFTLNGLILGDRGLGVAGTRSTLATAQSAVGSYAIDGSFTSREGYAVNVVPGQLNVTAAPPPPPPPPPNENPPIVPPNPILQLYTLPRVDYYRDQPDTWVYDRNIGFAPICVATGPLDTSRGAQEGDVLAREWSRVRTRPNLTSCVDTERHNGCSDF